MNRRHKKLILPSFQLRCIVLAVSVTLLAVITQALVFALLPHSGPQGPANAAAAVDDLLKAGALTLVVLTPFLVAVGLVVTHRVAGPIYRFQQYLRAVAEKHVTEPCAIRRQDEFQELCRRINEAVAALEARSATLPIDESAATRGAAPDRSMRCRASRHRIHVAL